MGGTVPRWTPTTARWASPRPTGRAGTRSRDADHRSNPSSLPTADPRSNRIVADHPGVDGSFLLVEHHPAWEVLGVRGPAALTLGYFGRDVPTAEPYDQAKRPHGSTEAPRPYGPQPGQYGPPPDDAGARGHPWRADRDHRALSRATAGSRTCGQRWGRTGRRSDRSWPRARPARRCVGGSAGGWSSAHPRPAPRRARCPASPGAESSAFCEPVGKLR